MPSQCPVIETERLILRPHEHGDFDAICALWREPDVFRHIMGKPSTKSDCWMRLLRYRGLWEILGFGYWAAINRADGAYVGDVGLADFHREMEPSIRGIPEAGWVLSSAFHGKGYGSEAVRAILGWADQALATEKTVCIIAPENRASHMLAAKMGYGNAQDAQFLGEPITLYERSKGG